MLGVLHTMKGVWGKCLLLIISEGPSIHGLCSIVWGAKAKLGGLQSQVLLKEVEYRD